MLDTKKAPLGACDSEGYSPNPSHDPLSSFLETGSLCASRVCVREGSQMPGLSRLAEGAFSSPDFALEM